jgi:septal ring factor EnvC (AmiA/AmiB activator)
MRCATCYLELEEGTKFCRDCGTPITASPSPSPGATAAEREPSRKAASPNATAAFAPDFSSGMPAEKVVPLAEVGDGSTAPDAPSPARAGGAAAGGGTHRGSRIALFVVAAVAVIQLGVVVIMAGVVWQLAPEATAVEKPISESLEEVARRRATEAADQQAERELAVKKYEIEKLDRAAAELSGEIVDRTREVKAISNTLADTKNRLGEVRAELAREEDKLTKRRAEVATLLRQRDSLRADIARGRRALKKGRAELAGVELKLTQLRGAVAQGEQRVSKLKRQLAGLNNVGGGRSTRQAGRRA